MDIGFSQGGGGGGGMGVGAWRFLFSKIFDDFVDLFSKLTVDPVHFPIASRTKDIHYFDKIFYNAGKFSIYWRQRRP